MIAVLTHALWRRRLSTLWWLIGIVAVAALIAVAYPTVRDNSELDSTFAHLSPGVQAILGMNGNPLSSPAGYLNSQFFANVLPIMLMIQAIGVAAWAIAGTEAAGTLELLLANPISRARVALARAAAIIILLAVTTAGCAAALMALAPGFGLDHGLPVGRLAAACATCACLALAYGAVTFAVGAATGSRPVALATGAALAVAGYVIEGLAQQVTILRPLRAISPWHWLLSADPLNHGLTAQDAALPLAVSLVLIGLGTLAFTRRDLR